MLPFALGAVVGAIAVTAIAESRIGKAFSKKGAKIIDTLEDRVSSLAQTVVENNDLCEKLKSGYETVSSKVNEIAEYCQTKGKDLAKVVKEKVADQKAEVKPAKPKKRAFVLTEEEKKARKAKIARDYYAKNKEAILAKNKEKQAGKTPASRVKRADKVKNLVIK